MDDQVFSDGIGQIISVGGTVRLDLVAYSPTETDSKGAPLLAFRQRIIMSTDNFLVAAEKIHEVATAVARQRGEGPKKNAAEPRAAASHAVETATGVSPATAPPAANRPEPKFP